jgi:tripartite-type tricarboxylate transporter receptor subunit TctC
MGALHTMMTIKCFARCIAACSLLIFAAHVSAGNAAIYPDRPIKIVVPFPAGGWVDSTARLIGEKLSEKYGKSVLIENRTGAGGGIGTEYVAKAPADGYTILCISPSHTILPNLTKKSSWDAEKDFRAVHGIGEIATVIAVHDAVPAENLAALLQLANERRDAPLTIGSGGVGTSIHLSGALLAQQADVSLNHIPYRGQPDAIADLIAGRITMMPLAASIAMPHVQSGALRVLATTSETRSAKFPDIPTVAEAGNLPDYQASTWTGFVAPHATPDGIVEQLSKDIALILEMEDVKTKLASLGIDLHPRDAAAFDTFIAAENKKWGQVIAQGNLQIE